jgi:hypothetical protein
MKRIGIRPIYLRHIRSAPEGVETNKINHWLFRLSRLRVGDRCDAIVMKIHCGALLAPINALPPCGHMFGRNGRGVRLSQQISPTFIVPDFAW